MIGALSGKPAWSLPMEMVRGLTDIVFKIKREILPRAIRNLLISLTEDLSFDRLAQACMPADEFEQCD